MPPEDTQNDQDLQKVDQLIAEAEAADAAEAAAKNQGATQAGPGSATEGQRADQLGAEEGSDGQPPTTDQPPKKSDTQAAPKAEKAKDGTEKQEDKPPSRYEKARQREAETWKKINQEKAELEARQKALEKERAEFEATRKAKHEPQEERPKYSAEEYEAAAERFEAAGKFEFADAARAAAKSAREFAAKEKAKPAEPQKAPAAPAIPEAEVAASWLKAKQEFPELLDPSSPLNGNLRDFLKANPAVLGFKDGPFLAADYVRSRIEAARVPDLLKAKATLEAKVKELEALTALPEGGVPNGMPREKAWGEMSLDEQERALEAEYAGAHR